MDRSVARILIVSGIVLAGAGLLMLLLPRFAWLGRLPGDFRWSRGGTTIFLPIATSLLLSALLTLLLNLFTRR